jgi:DNA-binding transcriptional MerR regulator
MGTTTAEAPAPVRRRRGGYAIRDVARATRLSESALRYYESIGLTPAVARDQSSGHRVYSQEDLDRLDAVACLSGTGMPIEDMRVYLGNALRGAAGASEQIGLLEAQRDRLDMEAEALRVRREYVELKVRYWQAVAAGDDTEAADIGEQARAVAQDVKGTRSS